MRRAWLPLLAILLVAGFAVTPASASGGFGHSHDEAHGQAALPLAALGLAASALGLAAARRWRRPVALLALGLLVAVFGVESSVHSAHHFGDPQGAASCALFAVSQHDDGVSAAETVPAIPTWTIEPSLPHEAAQVRSLQAFGSPEGRAPPVLPSA